MTQHRWKFLPAFQMLFSFFNLFQLLSSSLCPESQAHNPKWISLDNLKNTFGISALPLSALSHTPCLLGPIWVFLNSQVKDTSVTKETLTPPSSNSPGASKKKNKAGETEHRPALSARGWLPPCHGALLSALLMRPENSQPSSLGCSVSWGCHMKTRRQWSWVALMTPASGRKDHLPLNWSLESPSQILDLKPIPWFLLVPSPDTWVL